MVAMEIRVRAWSNESVQAARNAEIVNAVRLA